jgi:hypothetical protein
LRLFLEDGTGSCLDADQPSGLDQSLHDACLGG